MRSVAFNTILKQSDWKEETIILSISFAGSRTTAYLVGRMVWRKPQGPRGAQLRGQTDFRKFVWKTDLPYCPSWHYLWVWLLSNSFAFSASGVVPQTLVWLDAQTWVEVTLLVALCPKTGQMKGAVSQWHIQPLAFWACSPMRSPWPRLRLAGGGHGYPNFWRMGTSPRVWMWQRRDCVGWGDSLTFPPVKKPFMWYRWPGKPQLSCLSHAVVQKAPTKSYAQWNCSLVSYL